MMMVGDAYVFASLKHFGQVDKLGLPYILHPVAVSEKLMGENEKIVALLHDVVEDTDATVDDIQMRYGMLIGDAVNAITKREHETYDAYLRRCKANQLARAVKLADINHNTSPERMNQLPPETQERLRDKYTYAVRTLLD